MHYIKVVTTAVENVFKFQIKMFTAKSLYVNLRYFPYFIMAR